MISKTRRIGCKINLWLRVTGRLASGYHSLDSFFLPLAEPYDTLNIFQGSGKTGFTLTSSLPELTEIKTSLHKAYAAFAAETGFAPPLALHLEKGIPLGAGLGGGSADAAAILLYLNRLAASAEKSLTPEALCELASGIGADVPFFLYNTPARVSGIGEIISPEKNPFSGAFLLLLCPGIHVSTAWAFQALDAKASGAADNGQNKQSAHHNLTTNAGAYRNTFVHGESLQNDLEPVVFEQYPELARLRAQLASLGAFAARMSGSGSSLFGLFAREEAAAVAAQTLSDEGYRVFRHIL
jgi:4-diphosphocytidyl-2-C-methyl-D-erythritol kinase